MNSSHSHNHPHHPPHGLHSSQPQHLVFGQLPPHNTYEATHNNSAISPPSGPITVDTSSPPLHQHQAYGNYGAPTVSHPQSAQAQQQQQHQQQLSTSTASAQQQQQQPPPPAQSNGVGGAGRRGPGSIKWTKEGVSTSAERRLPFVHRFRPVGLPPPTGILESGNSTNSPGSGGPLPQGQQQQQQGQQQQQSNYHKKVTNKMSQYDTNPVGALQERYQSRGILPFYRVVHFEGMSHNPVFTYQVTIGEMTAIGTGNSKKQAKHAAARGMIDKLDGRTPATTPVLPPNTNLDTSADGSVTTQSSQGSNGSSTGKEGGAGAPTNPIGKIQEYCVKFSLPLPIYDLQNTIGQPHQRNFEIIAKVGSVNAIGSGTSKKDAKRSAASALLAKLKAMGNDVTSLSNIIPPANGTANSVGDIEEELELAKGVSGMKIETLTQKHSKVLQDFYKKLQDSGKAKLLALHRSNLREPNFDYVRLLAELGQEQGFEITYVDIFQNEEERSASGDHQCLVQLSTLPVAVCYGTGQTQPAANNDAARHALNYLKLMTKKSIPQSGVDPNSTKAKMNKASTNGK